MNDLFLKFLEVFFDGSRGAYTASTVTVASIAAPILSVVVWDTRIWVAGAILVVGLLLSAAAWLFTIVSNI